MELHATKTASLDQRPAHDREPPRSLVVLLGQILYRALVGYLVAHVITGAFVGLVLGLGHVLINYLESLRGESFIIVLMWTFLSAGMGGLFGAVFGALFAPTESQRTKRKSWAIAKGAAIGNLLGLLLAAHVGAIFGTALDFLYGQNAWKRAGEDVVLLPMAIGGGAGMVAGVLTGFWLRYRRKQRSQASAQSRSATPLTTGA
jgi:hypothetical protein